ncbi:M48 family metalloprotease [Undibacterium sp. 5I1]|uniref:M48 family metallopeptidase n=1 Tax=unclassified Undibacterium TaxID=2630295 RepID=UPI002AB58557|nr:MULTISPECIES: M48 family metalloprotease [unclassified Undibacterium]MDY7539364.1 M48 family metalloprotease [Undibacterium sp. 5I1]MEB0231191.1 M48 family metalloprotease [Undibacterium sp. 10I3]MEB0258527.1 M48 family metalloprotease [Undibacterium sp. 5I1]
MDTTTNSKINKSRTKGPQIAQRASLVLALWLGFWLLAIGLVIGLLWIPFAQLHYRSSLQFTGIVAGLAALSLAYSLRPRQREKTTASTAKPLSRETAAPLYAMVEKIATRLHIQAPVNIHLIGAASAFISGKRNWQGKIKTLEVGLGLPLLGTLSEQELGSVIAHEFGHFVAGDLSLGPWVYRTRMSIAHTVTDLDDSLFFLDLLFSYYGKWFLRLSSSVSRAQEFAADALASKTFGIVATRTALEKVHLIDPMWSTYLDYELGPAINRGARMPIFEGFRRFSKLGVKRAAVQVAIKRAETRKASEFDTHPSLEERVSALVPGAKPSFPPLSHCWELLGGEQATEAAWYALFDADKLTTSDWDAFGEQVLQTQIQQRFAGSWMDPKQLAFTELVTMAQRPEDSWDKLKPEGVSFLSPQGKRNHVLDILEEWIAACLIHRGFKLKATPGQPWVMLREDKAIQPAELLQQALGGSLRSVQLAQFDLKI